MSGDDEDPETRHHINCLIVAGIVLWCMAAAVILLKTYGYWPQSR